MTKQLLIFAISSLLLAMPSYAQESINTCGTGAIPELEYAKMVTDSKLFQQAIATKTVATEVVPIHFTIVRDVSCSNDRYSIIPKLIKGTGNQDGILDLIQKYFPFDFSLAGIKYVIDSDLANIPNATLSQKFTKDSKLYNLNKGIKAINIYIVNTERSYAYLPGFNPCIPKNCKLPDDNLVVLSEAKIFGVNTFEKELAHELGHYFGLHHTFTGTEDLTAGVLREKVTRGATKNCENVSDRFCQTEADPGAVLCSLNYPSDCQNTTPCGNNLLDQEGLPYTPLKFNLMSYYYATTRCNTSPQVAFSFVDEQKNLMLYNLNNHLNRTFLKTSFQNLGIVGFHAGEIRKAKCDDPLFINATPLKDVTVDIGSFGNKSCKTLPADCGHYIGQNDWASTGIQKILPYKNNDPLNGVDMLDVVAIRNYVLGIAPLGSAYQFIAADVSNSGSVSTLDIVMIRKLILGITPNIFTPSWRFLSYLHENEMDVKPFATSDPFQNSYKGKKFLKVGTIPSYLDHVDIDYSNQNVAYNPVNWSFKGIKMGDVNCDASPLLKVGQPPNETITTKNNFELIPPNKTLVINVLLNKDVPIEAYQLQLDYDASKVELLKVEPGDDERNSIEDNFNTRERGIIRTVWNSNDDNKLDSKPQYSLFKLHFKILSKIENPDDLLHLSNEGFYNVFYNTNNMTATNTDLTFLATMEENSGGFKVQKIKFNTTITVYPNPTKNEFYLNIPLSVSGNIQIQVMDIIGKVLKNINIEGTEGQNEILINDLNLAGTNMLHYNIQTAEGNYQGKVLIAK